MHDEFYSVTEKLKTIFLESNNQFQHDLLYGGDSLSISLNLKLASVPYATPKWSIPGE